jgi:hypothetical protein
MIPNQSQLWVLSRPPEKRIFSTKKKIRRLKAKVFMGDGELTESRLSETGETL